MPRNAILVPYCVDQNQPSKPLSFLVDIPDDEQQRYTLLRALFKEHVYDELEDDAEVIIRETEEYGDLSVTDDDILYLFVTFVALS